MLFAAFAVTFLILWAAVYAALPAVRHLGRLLSRVIARNTRVTRFVTTTRERFRNYLPVAAEMLRRANGYSFPSGHAMGSAVALGALAYLAFRAIRSWRVKTAVIAFLYTLVASIALSRVYLGVHWISDVLAGVTIGTVWVTTTTVAYETLRRIRRLRGRRSELS